MNDILTELLTLYDVKQRASEAYNEAVAAVEKEKNIPKAVLRRVVSAIHSDGLEKLSDEVRDISQMIGEVNKGFDSSGDSSGDSSCTGCAGGCGCSGASVV